MTTQITHTHGEPVSPHSLDEALAHVRNGGRLYVATYTRTTIIDKKVLTRFERAGQPVLKEEDKGYRMYSGKSSVYLMPGQLKYTS
jgi:hypothetical protein